jgi:hypothetical protein
MEPTVVEYRPRSRTNPGWWRVASMRGFVHDPESPAYIGLAPHDLSYPGGVDAVENALDAEGEGMFEGCEKHLLG